MSCCCWVVFSLAICTDWLNWLFEVCQFVLANGVCCCCWCPPHNCAWVCVFVSPNQQQWQSGPTQSVHFRVYIVVVDDNNRGESKSAAGFSKPQVCCTFDWLTWLPHRRRRVYRLNLRGGASCGQWPRKFEQIVWREKSDSGKESNCGNWLNCGRPTEIKMVFF